MTQRGASAKQVRLIHGYCRLESNNMNIIDGIIMIIYEYHQIATWSKIYKGSYIQLFDDGTKAKCIENSGHSVRADFCINRGEIVSWEFDCYASTAWYYFYGVISSKQKNFNKCAGDENLVDGYGVEDDSNMIYFGKGPEEIDDENGKIIWNKPTFPEMELFTLKMTADWRNKQCKLSIFYESKKLNESNDDYTFLLPELDDKYVWYPCATPYYEGSYCIIRYV